MREVVLLCLILASLYGGWRFMGKTDDFFDSLEFPDQKKEDGESGDQK